VNGRAWRIVKTKWVETAFTGRGSQLDPGRWNSSVSAIVYTADSPASAVLEVLVHLENRALIRAYSMFEITFPEAAVEVLDLQTLPSNWYDPEAPKGLASHGDRWVVESRSPILKVPSVILLSDRVPQHFNYLLNPAHPDFAKIAIGEAKSLAIDSRLTAQ